MFSRPAGRADLCDPHPPRCWLLPGATGRRCAASGCLLSGLLSRVRARAGQSGPYRRLCGSPGWVRTASLLSVRWVARPRQSCGEGGDVFRITRRRGLLDRYVRHSRWLAGCQVVKESRTHAAVVTPRRSPSSFTSPHRLLPCVRGRRKGAARVMPYLLLALVRAVAQQPTAILFLNARTESCGWEFCSPKSEVQSLQSHATNRHL